MFDRDDAMAGIGGAIASASSAIVALVSLMVEKSRTALDGPPKTVPCVALSRPIESVCSSLGYRSAKVQRAGNT
jgi:hypothetical protein